MRIVCPDGTPTWRKSLSPELEAKLQQLGSFTWFEGRPETLEKYQERVSDADGVLLIWDIPAEVLSSSPKLRIVSFTGVNPRKFVNLAVATSKGIAVTNTPHYSDSTIAEHAFALILCCAKRIVQLNRLTHEGIWEQGLFNVDLKGKILGIVGLGGIGSEVALIAQGFGMKVIAHDLIATPERARKYNVQFVDLKELFQKADIVTIHLAHTPQTERMITRELLQLMKPGAIFVNTARGELVDNKVLAQLLAEKKLGAVGLDVYDVEPIDRNGPFLSLENAILTPHVANSTPEALASIMRISVDNLVAFSSGNPINVVNPEALSKSR